VVGQAIRQNSVKKIAENYFNVEYFSHFAGFKNTGESSAYSLWIHFDTLLDIQDFEKLRLPSFLLTTTTGVTHLGSDLRIQLGNRLLSLASEKDLLQQVTSTAEHAWSLLTAISNPWLQNLRVDKQLKRSDLLRLNQLSSRSIGIIGYGRLGRMVADYALAFGMQVYVYDIDYSIQIPNKEKINRTFSLEELLQNSNIISIHASVNADKKPILTEDTLRFCRRGTSIINTSRGCLVDEQAIVNLLNTKTIKWYATDVLNEEELGADKSPAELKERARTLNGVIITPHIGGANLEAMEFCERNLLSRLIAAQSTGPEN
jgi:D-3-phosphoglycerate dehydrogenase / 2-oxoglutarate reductase